MNKRLIFNWIGECFQIYNSKEELIGLVMKTRVGSYMHWCLHTFEEIYFSAGCLDEVREFIKNPRKYIEKYPEQVNVGSFK